MKNELRIRLRILAAIVLVLSNVMVNAQTTLKKVYDENANPMEQIEQAVSRANDSIVSQIVEENFVYIHVNYNPRKSEGEEKMRLAKAMLQRLSNPERFGFPVFVVLDDDGRVIHIQDSSFLEEGKGYNREKVLRFFKNWTPRAVKGLEN